MELSNIDYQELQKLEESLWVAETRFDRAYMERVLAPDFFEFGRSGRMYTREKSLSAPAQTINAKLPLRDFAVHLIAPDVALVTYVSEVMYETVELANRSSLWTKGEKGWQLRFHQGTPL